jgi:hypothetical protein
MSDAARRLAQSRLAIIEEIEDREHRGDKRGMQDARDRGRAGEGRHRRAYGDAGGPGGWFASVRNALGTWWRHHPAHMAVELATPALAVYAQKRPFRYLGIAVAAGAVVALTRPWRLISVTGLLVAVVKSSQLSGLLMSALSAAEFQRERPPHE